MPEPVADASSLVGRVAQPVVQPVGQPGAQPGPVALERAAGVGVDVVGVTAFAAQLAEPGTRFARVFTPGERRTARRAGRSASQEAQSLAARWAAKEAVLKAWSSSHHGGPEVLDPAVVDLREIEVVSDAWGRPAVRLHGAIGAALAGRQVLLSLSHDPDADVAIAFVVLQEA